tara:strand:+ start:5230 stop:6159 length:930 start_codon:yes stop_codon:yes gene_type:complete
MSISSKTLNCHLLLDNFIKDDLLNRVNSNFLNDDKINYGNYDKIIAEILQQLKTKLNWDPIATKYRVSEGKKAKTSNSTDASNFHRDLNIFEGEDTPDIYTLIIYLDHAALDIIPHSCTVFDHNKLKNIQTVNFKPGDAILINASTLHRGNFETKYKTQSRKCIQIFEIYKNKEDYLKYSNKVLTLPGGGNKQVEYISQSWYNIPLLNTYIKDKGRQNFTNKVRKNRAEYSYLSTESQRPRVTKNIDNGNYYRLLLKTNDSKDSVRDYNNFIKPFSDSIRNDIILVICIIIFLILLYKFINSRGKKGLK